MAFFLLLRPPWLNRIALILAFFKGSFPLAQVGSQSCPRPLSVMGGSDLQNCIKANNDILYFRADYHVNNFQKFLTWTQNRASAVKWASLVYRAYINRHVLRFKLLVRFKCWRVGCSVSQTLFWLVAQRTSLTNVCWNERRSCRPVRAHFQFLEMNFGPSKILRGRIATKRRYLSKRGILANLVVCNLTKWPNWISSVTYTRKYYNDREKTNKKQQERKTRGSSDNMRKSVRKLKKKEFMYKKGSYNWGRSPLRTNFHQVFL